MCVQTQLEAVCSRVPASGGTAWVHVRMSAPGPGTLVDPVASSELSRHCGTPWAHGQSPRGRLGAGPSQAGPELTQAAGSSPRDGGLDTCWRRGRDQCGRQEAWEMPVQSALRPQARVLFPKSPDLSRSLPSLDRSVVPAAFRRKTHNLSRNYKASHGPGSSTTGPLPVPCPLPGRPFPSPPSVTPLS